MRRENRFVMLLDDHELATFEAMAQMEKLPVGTFIRRRLLFEADQRGISPRYGEKSNRGAKDSDPQRAAIVA